jgi:hypothetical protein
VSRFTPDGRQFRKDKQHFLAVHPICVFCGHGGANELHHDPPASVAPELAKDPRTWRPSHGQKGCPVCGKHCNQEYGTGTGAVKVRSRAW